MGGVLGGLESGGGEGGVWEALERESEEESG